MGATASVEGSKASVEFSTGYQKLQAYNDMMGLGYTDMATKIKPERFNTLQASPAGAKYKLAVVQFKVPGAKNGGTDKGPDGNRIDSIPIANGVVAAGGACDLILFDSEKNGADVEEFKTLTAG